MSKKFKYSFAEPRVNIKHIKCSVCDCEFAPFNNKAHYVAQRLDGTFVDAFDCPRCGCQTVVGERYEKVKATEGESCRKTYEEACAAYEDAIRRRFSTPAHTFQNVRSFTQALEDIHDCMDDYKYINLAGFKNIIGEPCSYTDEGIGWDNILDMKIEVDGNGYTLIMPPFNWEAK